MAKSNEYICTHCEYVAPSLPAARRHSKEAGPVWNPMRQTFTGHVMERVIPEFS